jgi:hypothetical protein
LVLAAFFEDRLCMVEKLARDALLAGWYPFEQVLYEVALRVDHDRATASIEVSEHEVGDQRGLPDRCRPEDVKVPALDPGALR